MLDALNTSTPEIPAVILITGIVLAGLWLSNIAYDSRVPNYISRKIGHGFGGVAFLLGVYLFSSSFWPIVLTALFGILLLLARLFKPDTFRGVGGSSRSGKSLSEIWFAWVALPVFGVSWLWLDKPTVALASLLFMAWGDCVTGLVRSRVYRKPCKGIIGSLAMLLICLLIGWAFIKPFWIGIIASLVAVGSEWLFGDVAKLKWGDDNWAIPVFSMGAILSLMAVNGNPG